MMEPRSAAAATVKSHPKRTRDPMRLPPPFLAMGRASFWNPSMTTQLVSINLPVQYLRNRDALHSVVLRRFLHRVYVEGGADAHSKMQLPDSTHGRRVTLRSRGSSSDDDDHTGEDGECTAAKATVESTRSVTPPEGDGGAQGPRLIVNVTNIEPVPDSARQLNAKGDVQVHVLLSLLTAEVPGNGIVAGKVVALPYPSYAAVEVRLAAASASSLSSNGRHPSKKGKHVVPEERPVVVLTHCGAEQRGVQVGSAVLVVAEPSCLRCISVEGVRPVRPASPDAATAEESEIAAPEKHFSSTFDPATSTMVVVEAARKKRKKSAE